MDEVYPNENEIKDFGWLNRWHKNPPAEITKCRELQHKLISRDDGHIKMRGLDTVYTCVICKIKYHVDSSD